MSVCVVKLQHTVWFIAPYRLSGDLWDRKEGFGFSMKNGLACCKPEQKTIPEPKDSSSVLVAKPIFSISNRERKLPDVIHTISKQAVLSGGVLFSAGIGQNRSCYFCRYAGMDCATADNSQMDQ